MTVAIRPAIRRSRPADCTAVLDLLDCSGLPTEDLSVAPNLQMWVADDDMVLGVVGLERFGTDGLLRSLAVAPEHRQRGLGHELVARLERDAQAAGIRRLVLLTETAEPFFRRQGYEIVNRGAVSESVRRSAEFRSLCPVSAICMSKLLMAEPGDVRTDL